MKADSKKVLHRLKIVRGQIDGIINMVEEDRYCIDISTQLLAAIAGLKSVNNEVLKGHLESCVRDSIVSQDRDDLDKKIDEIIKIINKINI